MGGGHVSAFRPFPSEGCLSSGQKNTRKHVQLDESEAVADLEGDRGDEGIYARVGWGWLSDIDMSGVAAPLAAEGLNIILFAEVGGNLQHDHVYRSLRNDVTFTKKKEKKLILIVRKNGEAANN